VDLIAKLGEESVTYAQANPAAPAPPAYDTPGDMCVGQGTVTDTYIAPEATAEEGYADKLKDLAGNILYLYAAAGALVLALCCCCFLFCCRHKKRLRCKVEDCEFRCKEEKELRDHMRDEHPDYEEERPAEVEIELNQGPLQEGVGGMIPGKDGGKPLPVGAGEGPLKLARLPDQIICPTCGEKFTPEAAARHIPWCKGGDCLKGGGSLKGESKDVDKEGSTGGGLAAAGAHGTGNVQIVQRRSQMESTMRDDFEFDDDEGDEI